MKKAFIFPGQGGQAIGMGRDLYNENPAAKAVFDEVDDALGEKLSELMFGGDAEILNLTANAQPAIFAVSLAMWAALNDRAGEFVAGHSLGEYSALCAAGAIGIADCAKLLRKRGLLMQSAATGGMAAIIGDVDLAKICADAGCEFANDNAPGQGVISGEIEKLDKAMELAKGQGAKLVKRLAVSAPFHSSLMSPIADEMRAEINKYEWKTPEIPFVSNKTAEVMTDIEEIKESLVHQLTHGVRWRESILWMRGQGIEEFAEIG